MQQTRLLGILLTPSLLSISACLVIAFGVLGITVLPYAVQNSFIASLASIDPVNLAAIIAQTETHMALVASTILDRTEFYAVFVTVVAAIIGLMVFTTLELLTRGADDIKESIEELRYAKSRFKEQIEREVALRWVIRGGAMIGWILYALLWLNVVLLFAIFIVRIGTTLAPDLVGIGYVLFGTLILIASIHIHVIFMRLILLRPRVFGIIE